MSVRLDPGWLNRTVTPGGRRAGVAFLEFLPLAPIAAQFSPLTPDDQITPLWVLGFTTGLGWALAGRWRMGLVIALARVVVLWLGMYVVLYTSFANWCGLNDVDCAGGDWQSALATPAVWVVATFYVITAVGSALFAIRAATERGAD